MVGLRRFLSIITPWTCFEAPRCKMLFTMTRNHFKLFAVGLQSMTTALAAQNTNNVISYTLGFNCNTVLEVWEKGQLLILLIILLVVFNYACYSQWAAWITKTVFKIPTIIMYIPQCCAHYHPTYEEHSNQCELSDWDGGQCSEH